MRILKIKNKEFAMLKRIALVFLIIITGQLNCGPLLNQWIKNQHQQNVTLEIANEADRGDLNIILNSPQIGLPPEIFLLINLKNSSILPDQLSTLCEMLAHYVKAINIHIGGFQFAVDELLPALKKLTAVNQLKIWANDSEENVPQKIINCLPSVSRLTIAFAKKKLDLSKLKNLNSLKLVASHLSRSDSVETYKTAPACCRIKKNDFITELSLRVRMMESRNMMNIVILTCSGLAAAAIFLIGFVYIVATHINTPRIPLFNNNLSAQQQLAPIIFYNNTTRIFTTNSTTP